MTKEEFKQMFTECFSLDVSVGWTPMPSQAYALKIAIVDRDTGEIITEDCVATYSIKD